VFPLRCTLLRASLKLAMPALRVQKEVLIRQGRKLIARQYANGWQIEIVLLQHGAGHAQTSTFRELTDAINRAKKIVDANRKIAN
jgi:hypothetical protein